MAPISSMNIFKASVLKSAPAVMVGPALGCRLFGVLTVFGIRKSPLPEKYWPSLSLSCGSVPAALDFNRISTEPMVPAASTTSLARSVPLRRIGSSSPPLSSPMVTSSSRKPSGIGRTI